MFMHVTVRFIKYLGSAQRKKPIRSQECASGACDARRAAVVSRRAAAVIRSERGPVSAAICRMFVFICSWNMR